MRSEQRKWRSRCTQRLQDTAPLRIGAPQCMQCSHPQSRASRAALFTAAGLLVVALASMGLSGSRQGQQQGGGAGSGGTGGAAGAEKVGAGLLLT